MLVDYNQVKDDYKRKNAEIEKVKQDLKMLQTRFDELEVKVNYLELQAFENSSHMPIQ